LKRFLQGKEVLAILNHPIDLRISASN